MSLRARGLDTDVINAVLEEDGILYAATDSGIAAIDMSEQEREISAIPSRTASAAEE